MRALPTCCAMALLCGLVTAAEPANVESSGLIDPLWEAIAIESEPSGSVAGDPCNSTQIGNYGVVFSGPNRFRGNMIKVPSMGNELRRFGMELNIPAGLTGLTFWVFQRQANTHFEPVRSIQMDTVGAGQSYYWSPEFQEFLTLTPNVDYAIGISWEAVTIAYGRDNLTNPRPFSNGTIVGSVGATVPFEMPLTLIPGSTGAYAMRLCFSPMPGACCVPASETCQPNIFQDECEIDFNGHFQGPATTCATNPCNFGVCCTLTGECLEHFTLDACTEVPGNWSDVETCNDIAPCPVLAGACCMGTSCIDSMTQADCTTMPGGMFRGNGTQCDSLQPECGKGACCSDFLADGCAETTVTNCGPDVGHFQGLHTRCIDSAGSCPGRCCVGTPAVCLADRTPDECSDFNGVFIGFDNSPTCGSDCLGPNGSGASGKCCLPDGGCALTNLSGCNNLQGVFTLTGVCTAPGACPGTGACCNGSICVELTQAGCVDPIWGGTFLGVGSTCTPGVCIDSNPGGCCIGTSCTPTAITRVECLAMNGEFLGENTTCGPLSCQPFGACCEPDGDCMPLAQSVCVANGGTFQGDGVSCAGTNCPQPQYACCRSGLSCVVATAAMCATMGGTSQTGVTSCAAANCPAACCLPAGSCMNNQTPAQCTGLNGQHLGDGTVCGAGSCPTGACCMGESCEVRTQAFCNGQGGSYEGNGTVCNPNPCETADISIVSSVPPNGSIDARQPFALPGCPTPQGENIVVLTFDGPATGLVATDFTIMSEPAGAAIGIANVVPSSTEATLILSGPIPPSHWTRITHNASGTFTRIGFLPADVNNDRSASPVDILKLIDHLNGVESFAIYQTDIDRSGVTNPADVLRVIDLLNGADCYDPYNGATLPP